MNVGRSHAFDSALPATMIQRIHHLLHPRNIPAPDPSTLIESEGHCLLRRVFSQNEVAKLREDIVRIYEEYQPDHRPGSRSPEFAAMFRYEMFNRSERCRKAIGNEQILQAVEPLLGEDCHVISCTAWRNPPQTPEMPRGQEWHIDHGPHVPRAEGVAWPSDIPYPVFVIGTHIYLDPVGIDDGPFAALPTSHTSGRIPPEEKKWDVDLEFEGCQRVLHLAEPGDVGFFVSDVWHRRMPPTERSTGRFFLQTNYGRRDIAQRVWTTDRYHCVRPETQERLTSDRERELLGLHPAVFYDG